MGVLYYRNEQITDAQIAFQKALNLEPDLLEGVLNIGLIYEQCGDYINAQRVYVAAQQKFPNMSIFNERLAVVLSCQHTRCKRTNQCQLIDIEDSRFIPSPSEQFANEYIACVPRLPNECFGIGDSALMFGQLATYPKSFFP